MSKYTRFASFVLEEEDDDNIIQFILALQARYRLVTPHIFK